MIQRNLNDYTVSFSNTLPSGDLWNSKQIPESNLYKLLYGLSYILLETDILMNEFKKDFLPINTEYFLSEWEKLLGIPDGCLESTGTNEERRNNIVGCLAALVCITKEDWINLASVMGFEIEIDYMNNLTLWPWVWPHVWGGTATQNRFITVITFKNLTNEGLGLWPWTWPHIWGTDVTKAIKCIFGRIKPATNLLVYRYL